MMTIRTLGTEINADRVQYASDMMGLSVDELFEQAGKEAARK